MFKKSAFLILGFVIIGVILAGIYFLAKFIWHQFISLDDQVAAAIITTGTTVIISVIVVVVGKYLEKQKEIEQQHRDKKAEIYEKFMEGLFGFLGITSQTSQIRTKKGGVNLRSEIELKNMLEEFSRKIILWGGDEVIKEYAEFRRAGSQKNAKNDYNILFGLEEILFKIRKDLGHSNRGLERKDLLALFITDLDNLKEL